MEEEEKQVSAVHQHYAIFKATTKMVPFTGAIFFEALIMMMLPLFSTGKITHKRTRKPRSIAAAQMAHACGPML